LPCGVVGLPVLPPGWEPLLPAGGVVGPVWVPLPDGGVGVVGLPVFPPGWGLLLPCGVVGLPVFPPGWEVLPLCGGVELLAPGCVVPEELGCELSRFLRKP
jgi:hypothetical protein